VLCAGSMLLLVQSYAPDKAPYINCLELSPSQLASTFRSWFFLLLVRLNLSFILRETCHYADHTFLLGFPTGWLAPPIKHFSGAAAVEKEDFCKGGSLASNLLLCYFFAYFLYFILLAFFIKNTKKISFFYSWYFVTFTFSPLCYSLSTS
jgi:hypothetical protein